MWDGMTYRPEINIREGKFPPRLWVRAGTMEPEFHSLTAFRYISDEEYRSIMHETLVEIAKLVQTWPKEPLAKHLESRAEKIKHGIIDKFLITK